MRRATGPQATRPVSRGGFRGMSDAARACLLLRADLRKAADRQAIVAGERDAFVQADAHAAARAIGGHRAAAAAALSGAGLTTGHGIGGAVRALDVQRARAIAATARARAHLRGRRLRGRRHWGRSRARTAQVGCLQF